MTQQHPNKRCIPDRHQRHKPPRISSTLGLVTFLPVLGGWLVALIGYPGIFGVGLGFALLGLAAALPLTEADSMLPRRSRPFGRREAV